MPHGLAASLVGVIDNPETVFGKTEVMGQFPDHLEDVPNQFIVSGRQIQSPADMFPWHDQKVIWSLGIDILKDNNLTYAANQICVTGGAKMACFNAILAVIEEGERMPDRLAGRAIRREV